MHEYPIKPTSTYFLMEKQKKTHAKVYGQKEKEWKTILMFQKSFLWQKYCNTNMMYPNYILKEKKTYM